MSFMFQVPMERRVLQIVLLHGGWMNANEIAQRAGISWNTAEKHLIFLNKRGLISTKKFGTIRYFKAKTLF